MQSSIIHRQIGSRAAPERVGEIAGIAGLLRDCAEGERRVFLFGGDSRAIYTLREQVAAVFPTVRIAGICDADFAGPIDRAVLDHIAAAKADVIVTDLPETRFRLFCAQCAAMGIYGKRINLPGSFADFAFGPAKGFLGLSVPARLRRIGAAARAGLRFTRLVLRQGLSRSGAGHALPGPPRRGGRG
ncbi:WecB/TagA/CpsF family glycosyltransferase [Bosea beijingensis]|uniref:WecB/TagA/CpsF family glycosyltransferase n=1 Tax=Bosea beijingensis TaxID=3068632 RepID=UPI00274126F8|nr:WecB/TagA/CpsF family glycosyltransferase [Bosea sp. REN20]